MAIRDHFPETIGATKRLIAAIKEYRSALRERRAVKRGK